MPAVYFALNPAISASNPCWKRFRGVQTIAVDSTYVGRTRTSALAGGVKLALSDVVEVNDRDTYNAIVKASIEDPVAVSLPLFVELPSGTRTLDFEGIIRGTVSQ